MNLFATSPQWIVWLLVVLLAAATIQDTLQLKISNFISGSVLLLAIVAMVASGPHIGLWQNLLVFALVLTVGATLFARNMLGGGDVKLFATVALWVDLATALRLVIAIVLVGGLLALLIVLLRTVTPGKVAARVKTLRPKAGIPYGVAIAAGTLLVLAMPAPSQTEVPGVPLKMSQRVPAHSD